MERRQLGYISFAYAVGCILVVFGHSYPLGDAVTPRWMDVIRTAIYVFHMPLFFFISGYLLNFTNAVLKRGYFPFLKQKAKQLLVPYVLLSMLGYIPKLIASKYISDNVELSGSYFLRSLLVPRENIWGHFWFIPALFLIYTVAASLIVSVSKLKNPTALNVLPAVLLLASLLLHLFPIKTGWFSLSDACVYGLYFSLGYFCCSFAKGIFPVNRWVTLFSIVAFVGLVAMRVSGLIPLRFMLVPAIAMIYLILAAGRLYEKGNCQFLRFLQGKTFTIFLLSWPFQAIVEVLFNKVLKLNWYLVSFFMFVAGLVMPLIIYQLVRKLPDSLRRRSWVIGIQGE